LPPLTPSDIQLVRTVRTVNLDSLALPLPDWGDDD
jgi:hypothetical protein